ncbi:MAG: hypothetical protein IJR34_00995 [Bacteroidales bacterium]|nr:hypothetical protein [Bacteroidales bacterium]
MKKILFATLVALALPVFSVQAQQASDQSAAQAPSVDPQKKARMNMVLKEWNLDVRTNKTYLDHVTTYNDQGKKIEEIEYNAQGQVWRKRYEHNAAGKVSKEYIYDQRNVLTSYKVFEYNSLGLKTKQTNYFPNGKAKTIKTFDYSAREDSQDKSAKKK